MRKVIAVAFALFGFASQALADGPMYATCSLDGEQAMKVNTRYDNGPGCSGSRVIDTYEHYHMSYPNKSEKHTFTVISCYGQ